MDTVCLLCIYLVAQSRPSFPMSLQSYNIWTLFFSCVLILLRSHGHLSRCHCSHIICFQCIYLVSQSRRDHHHHIVSATALIHRTARPSIPAMSSLLGISPKCVQLIVIWFRSHVATLHMYTVFVLTVAPLMFAAVCVTTRELFFWMGVIFLQVALGSLPPILPLRDTSFCGLTQERLGG